MKTLKTIILSLILVLLLSCKGNNNFVGEITGYSEYPEVSIVQSLMGVEKGNYYTLITNSGENYLLFTGTYSDVLEIGLKGTFICGEEMFEGTAEHYVDKKLKRFTVTAYRLIEYK